VDTRDKTRNKEYLKEGKEEAIGNKTRLSEKMKKTRTKSKQELEEEAGQEKTLFTKPPPFAFTQYNLMIPTLFLETWGTWGTWETSQNIGTFGSTFGVGILQVSRFFTPFIKSNKVIPARGSSAKIAEEFQEGSTCTYLKVHPQGYCQLNVIRPWVLCICSCLMYNS